MLTTFVEPESES